MLRGSNPSFSARNKTALYSHFWHYSAVFSCFICPYLSVFVHKKATQFRHSFARIGTVVSQ
nr:MAG TPA: hypothetical protein [Caudoviricetes sp.]